MTKKILYIRNFPNEVDPTKYNLQEIGFGSALVRLGYNCDVVYFSEKKGLPKETIYEFNKRKLSLFRLKGINMFNQGIYPSILKREFLDQYDFIITTEYSQVMTFFLAITAKAPLLLYHGPYRDPLRMNFLHKIYDYICLKTINKKVEKIFTKSDLAKQYLKDKGFNNIRTIGVGLNNSNFENANTESNEVKKLTGELEVSKAKVLLYVGNIDENKNIRFLYNVFLKIRQKESNSKLIIVGKGQESYTHKLNTLADELGISNDVIHLSEVKQSDLPNIYKIADLFFLPSKYDIFGMVLLESMYFGVPVLSSYNGGASTMIENKINGYILNEFDVDKWAETALNVMGNKELSLTLSNNAKKTIENEYLWDELAKVFIEELSP